MQTLLRLDRREPEGWTLADGPHTIGWIIPGRITFTGFPDSESTALAAATAARLLRDWTAARARLPRGNDQCIHLTLQSDGFAFDLPDDIWHAVLIELAQRIHVATLSLRHPVPEPAA